MLLPVRVPRCLLADLTNPRANGPQSARSCFQMIRHFRYARKLAEGLVQYEPASEPKTQKRLFLSPNARLSLESVRRRDQSLLTGSCTNIGSAALWLLRF